MPRTRICLSAAVLVVLSYSPGPASAESLGVGDFDPPWAVQQGPSLIRQENQRPSHIDPFAPQTPDADDFGPAALAETAAHAEVTPEDTTKSWYAWHRRVSGVVRERFQKGAPLVFKDNIPRTCEISYVVASDGRVGNVRVLHVTGDAISNSMLVDQIKSMKADTILEFPSDSKRKFVKKFEIFFWNLPFDSIGPCDFPPKEPPQIGPDQVRM